MDNPLCQFLDWDSNFFGFRIGRVKPNRLTPGDEKYIHTWCETEQIRCLYFLADSGDPVTSTLASQHGFRLVDVRMTLELSRNASNRMAPSIRPARAEDVAGLAEIARSSHTDSRFYFDERFPRERCDHLYETWIRRSCLEGFADAVLVAEQDSRPAGYITCSLSAGVGSVGLIAVADWARGAGHGSGLVRSALAWFEERNVSAVRVVTQGRNVQAQRLYQRCGFVTASVELWHHRWFA